jgi:hypothetical protein
MADSTLLLPRCGRRNRASDQRLYYVGRVGIEPTTRGLKARFMGAGRGVDKALDLRFEASAVRVDSRPLAAWLRPGACPGSEKAPLFRAVTPRATMPPVTPN